MPRFLMVGGPLAGQVRDLPGRPYHLEPIPGAPPAIPTPKAMYELVKVNLFGLLLAIYVEQDTSPYQRDRDAAAHLLSGLAHELHGSQGLGYARPQGIG